MPGSILEHHDMSDVPLTSMFKQVLGRILHEPINAILLCFVVGYGAYYMTSIEPQNRRENAASLERFQQQSIDAGTSRDQSFKEVLLSVETKHVEHSRQQRQDYLKALQQQNETSTKQFEFLRDSIKELKETIQALGRAALEVKDDAVAMRRQQEADSGKLKEINSRIGR